MIFIPYYVGFRKLYLMTVNKLYLFSVDVTF